MILLAMDKAPSVRSFDADGRLHVAKSNISKGNICPYLGREIPKWRELGLDPERIYHLFRDPEELARAVSTFNNLPLLSEHVPVDASGDESHMADLVVGSTGTDAAMDGQFLTNSLVIWAKPSIDGVVNDEKRELSSAYRYTADMTPGNFEGVDYDGVMRDIVGNHVALVIEGRAGSDVVVGDEKPMTLKSRRALMVSGALAATLRPHLAQDAKLDITAALVGVSDKSLSKKGATKALADKVFGLSQPHLAQDADLNVNDICKVIDTVQGTAMADDEDDNIDPLPTPAEPAAAVDGEGEGAAVAKLMNYLKGKLDDAAYAEAAKLIQTEEALDENMADEDKNEVDGKTAEDEDAEAAMDKKIEAVKAGFKALRVAEQEVIPVTGALTAMDSAEEVYAAGLKALGVDTKGLPKEAFGATFRAVSAQKAAPAVAMDHAGAATARDSFAKRFANRTNLVKG
jgi:hypothetical protein